MPKTKPSVFDGQNISASEFFQAHWQRSPFLFRNTSLKLNYLPSIEQLFELASWENVQSRIVFSEDDVHYQAIYDEPEAWDEVTNFKPTLLVSDIEKWHPKAMQIMSWFPFIKNWRFDDLMMSYAPKGASVGAHTDHYDVFLIQVQGTRQWSFDDQPLANKEVVENSELAVLTNYQPQHSVELKPGDILYLPPEIPHHGVSTSDDCVTCSIGLRAPADSELLNSVIELLNESSNEAHRFTDATSHARPDNAIGSHEIKYLRLRLQQIADLSDEALAQLFGQTVTNYRVFEDTDHSISKFKDTSLWQKSPFAVFAYYPLSDEDALLMINGEAQKTSLRCAEMICNNDYFAINGMNQDDNENTILKNLIENQIICPAQQDN